MRPAREGRAEIGSAGAAAVAAARVGIAVAAVGCGAIAAVGSEIVVARTTEVAVLTPVGGPTGAARTGQPPRIVSLSPPASALLAAMGAADLVVARAADDRTPALQDRPIAGFVLRPTPEAIRAADPDLVVVVPLVDAARLAALLPGSVRVRTVRLERLGDVGRVARELGVEVGRGGDAERLATEIERSLAEIGAWPEGCARPHVVWAVGLEPPVVAASQTLPDDLLAVAGARNAFAKIDGWRRPGLESLVAVDADIVIWPRGPELGPARGAVEAPTWGRVPAIREGRVISLDATLVHEAGPRVAEAARAVAAALRAPCGPVLAPLGSIAPARSFSDGAHPIHEEPHR